MAPAAPRPLSARPMDLFYYAFFIHIVPIMLCTSPSPRPPNLH